jgi:hypothetical protein
VASNWRRGVSSRKEGPLEAKCVGWARERGVQVGKLTECVGLPDRIFFTPRAKGGPDMPEFKRPDKRGASSPAQEWHVAELKRKGYKTWFCDSFEEFIAVMGKRGLR